MAASASGATTTGNDTSDPDASAVGGKRDAIGIGIGGIIP